MKPRSFKAITIALFMAASLLAGEAHAQVKDYLKVPGPVTFNKEKFNLAWSSHPTDAYYKHEYVKPGDKVETFKEMVLLEFAVGNQTAKEMLSAKVAELENRKKTDPLVNYEVIESPDGKEYILDFIMSSGPAEALEIAEWNAYRYRQVQEKSGKTGVMLYGISRRAYGNAITPFLKALKTKRPEYRNSLASATMPAINLGKK